MEYRKLGVTDVDVSVICLGTMTYGEQNTEAEAHEQLDYAVSQGVNFIDTAELYPVPARAETSGLTEDYIGTWLNKRAKRDDLILATKIAGPGPYTAHIRETPDYTKESISQAVDNNLKRLQTDYIDLYQIHWPARKTNFFGTRGYSKKDDWQNNFLTILQGLQEQVDAGKIRFIGISNETPWGLMEYLKLHAVHGLPRVMSVQNPYNLLNRTYETGLSEMSIREKAGLLAYSPMAFGLLSGKYHKKLDAPGDRMNKFKTMSRYNTEQCRLATQQYIEIAEKYGISPAQMSLAWINQQEFVTANIIGATSMEHEVQNSIPNPAP